MKYSVFIQFDEKNQIYVASIPELPGCKAHGVTKEKALEELEIACDLWIETAKEIGREIPEPTYYNPVTA